MIIINLYKPGYTPSEARACVWSGQEVHPDDLRICSMTGLSIHLKYVTSDMPLCLSPLNSMVIGLSRTRDKEDIWPDIETRLAEVLKKGKCKVEAAELSPDRKHIAGCSEVRTLFGFRTQHVGFIYSLQSGTIAGRITAKKRA